MSFHVGIAQALAAIEGLAYSEVADGNVFVDALPSTPDRAVAVYALPGQEPDSKLPYDPVRFQVVARSEDGGVWAEATLAAVYSFLHGKRNVTLPDGTYLVFALSTQASALSIGPDENGRARLSQTFRGEILNRTQERP